MVMGVIHLEEEVEAIMDRKYTTQGPLVTLEVAEVARGEMPQQEIYMEQMGVLEFLTQLLVQPLFMLEVEEPLELWDLEAEVQEAEEVLEEEQGQMDSVAVVEVVVA